MTDRLVADWSPSGGYSAEANDAEKAHVRTWLDHLRQHKCKKYTLLGFQKDKAWYKHCDDTDPLRTRLGGNVYQNLTNARGRKKRRLPSSTSSSVKRVPVMAPAACWSTPTLFPEPRAPARDTTGAPLPASSPSSHTPPSHLSPNASTSELHDTQVQPGRPQEQQTEEAPRNVHAPPTTGRARPMVDRCLQTFFELADNDNDGTKDLGELGAMIQDIDDKQVTAYSPERNASVKVNLQTYAHRLEWKKKKGSCRELFFNTGDVEHVQRCVVICKHNGGWPAVCVNCKHKQGEQNCKYRQEVYLLERVRPWSRKTIPLLRHIPPAAEKEPIHHYLRWRRDKHRQRSLSSREADGTNSSDGAAGGDGLNAKSFAPRSAHDMECASNAFYMGLSK